jgi:hypothetical protein
MIHNRLHTIIAMSTKKVATKTSVKIRVVARAETTKVPTSKAVNPYVILGFFRRLVRFNFQVTERQQRD